MKGNGSMRIYLASKVSQLVSCRWMLRRDLRESYRRHTYRPQCGERSYIHRTLRKAWFRIYSLTYQFNSFPTRFGVLIIIPDSVKIIKILKEEKL